MHPDYDEMRRMRDEGKKLREIAEHFGISSGAVVLHILGCHDPLGLGAFDPGSDAAARRTRFGETPVQRAFRRFPIAFRGE
jgi:hypothetical protein